MHSVQQCVSLRLSAVAAGCSVRAVFPVLGLQVQLHQPAAVENKAGWRHGRRCRYRSARGQRDCLRHQGRLLSTRRNSDGPRFYTGNEGSGKFLCRASGRHPNVRVPLVEALLQRGWNTRTDGLTVMKLLFRALSRNSDVSNASYHLAFVAPGVSNQNSRLDMLEQIEPRASCARESARACLFCAWRHSYCVKRAWHSWAQRTKRLAEVEIACTYVRVISLCEGECQTTAHRTLLTCCTRSILVLHVCSGRVHVLVFFFCTARFLLCGASLA